MGVDFAPCTACGETFPDCGHFAECNEDLGGCGRRYCSDDCAKLASPGRDHPWTWPEQEALQQEERDAIKTTCVARRCGRCETSRGSVTILRLWFRALVDNRRNGACAVHTAGA